MALKTDRIEARLSPDERSLIERAAMVAGMTTSAFLIGAAIDEADRVLSASLVTAVPEDYFDRLMAALDEPEVAPRLRDAVVRARENPRVHPG